VTLCKFSKISKIILSKIYNPQSSTPLSAPLLIRQDGEWKEEDWKEGGDLCQRDDDPVQQRRQIEIEAKASKQKQVWKVTALSKLSNGGVVQGKS
jgi:hypothetical protein